MKWLLVLLVLLAGGLTAAALAVPTNAATVNGTAISQQSLNADLNAIAGSPDYQCYLNSQAYLASSGEEQLPPIAGAGKGQDGSTDHPTADSGFVATYLSTDIGHQIILGVADADGVTVTPAQLTEARANLSSQITEIMSEILQEPAVAQNPRYTCGATEQALTGPEILGTLPSSFVDQQAQFVATAGALQEDFAGVGSSDADLQRYYVGHGSEFDTACFTAATFSSQSAAQEAAAEVAFGTPFSQVAAKATQSGQLQCSVLAEIAAELPSSAKLESLAVGGVSAPIDVNGTYYLFELTKRTPTPYATVQQAVAEVVQQVGAKATQTALTRAERRASVSVDPRYGVWVPVAASVLTPLTPSTSDVLNPSANEAGVTASAGTASGSSGTSGTGGTGG